MQSPIECVCGILEQRSGWHFFSDCKAELSESVYPEDLDEFLDAMNRKALMQTLSTRDTYVTSFRRMIDGKPVEAETLIRILGEMIFESEAKLTL